MDLTKEANKSDPWTHGNEASAFFRIAGINLRFDAPYPFPPGYASFRLEKEPEEIHGHFRFAEEDGFAFPELRSGAPLWDSSQWSLHETVDDRLLMRVRKSPLAEFQAAALLARDFSSGTLFPRRTTGNRLRSFPFCFPVDEQILLNLLARHKRALLHACSIETDGQALLFCGKSGAGKSTMAGFWRDAGGRILNDDRSLFQLDGEDGVLASASPWHGELPDISPDRFPVAAVFRLHQGETPKLKRCSPSEGLQMLLGNALAPFYLPDSLNPATETLSAVAARVPCYELTFAHDKGIVEFLKSALWSA